VRVLRPVGGGMRMRGECVGVTEGGKSSDFSAGRAKPSDTGGEGFQDQ